MKTTLKRAAMALALGGCALAAQAAHVTLTGWAFGAGGVVSGNLYAGWAGGFGGKLENSGGFDQNPFITYCVELSEHFSFGSSPMTSYVVVDADDYFAAGKSEKLGRLLTYVNADPTRVDNAAESISLQLAIWNIVYDSDFSVSTAGAFNDASTWAAYADTLLGGAQNTLVSAWNVFTLRSAGSQDFLLGKRRSTDTDIPNIDLPPPPRTGVPEPTSALLGLAALAGLGLSSRRRRRQR